MGLRKKKVQEMGSVTDNRVKDNLANPSLDLRNSMPLENEAANVSMPNNEGVTPSSQFATQSGKIPQESASNYSQQAYSQPLSQQFVRPNNTGLNTNANVLNNSQSFNRGAAIGGGQPQAGFAQQNANRVSQRSVSNVQQARGYNSNGAMPGQLSGGVQQQKMNTQQTVAHTQQRPISAQRQSSSVQQNAAVAKQPTRGTQQGATSPQPAGGAKQNNSIPLGNIQPTGNIIGKPGSAGSTHAMQDLKSQATQASQPLNTAQSFPNSIPIGAQGNSRRTRSGQFPQNNYGMPMQTGQKFAQAGNIFNPQQGFDPSLQNIQNSQVAPSMDDARSIQSNDVEETKPQEEKKATKKEGKTKKQKKKSPQSPAVHLVLENTSNDEQKQSSKTGMPKSRSSKTPKGEAPKAPETKKKDEPRIPNEDLIKIGKDHISVPQNMYKDTEIDNIAVGFPHIPQSLIFKDKAYRNMMPAPFSPNYYYPGAYELFNAARNSQFSGYRLNRFNDMYGDPTYGAMDPSEGIYGSSGYGSMPNAMSPGYSGIDNVLGGNPRTAVGPLPELRNPFRRPDNRFQNNSQSTATYSSNNSIPLSQGGTQNNTLNMAGANSSSMPLYTSGANSQPLGAQGAMGQNASANLNAHRAEQSGLRPGTPLNSRKETLPHGASIVGRGRRLGERLGFFDEPPVPISDGMRDADTVHARRRVMIIVGAILTVLAIVGAIVGMFIYTGANLEVNLDEVFTPQNNTYTEIRGDRELVAPKGSTSVDGALPTGEGAGEVVYQYTTATSDGTTYTVEETATFNDEGICTYTTMKMHFPNADVAKSFTDTLARDYGSAFKLDSLDGSNATVTINNTALNLDREAYENLLRYSVEDLVILKK